MARGQGGALQRVAAKRDEALAASRETPVAMEPLPIEIAEEAKAEAV